MKLSTSKPLRRPCTSKNHTHNIASKTHTKPFNNPKTHHQSNNAKLSHNASSNKIITINKPLFSSSSPVPRELQTHPNLGNNWMEYQGFKNWEGLLDPLDETLRGEIIRYGHFVEAAYRSCNFDPSSISYGQCKYAKNELLQEAGFARTGYKVVENLTATSSISLPGWAEKGPAWASARSSWIGYVAVSRDPREISRLGRRDVVIALRGTATCLEWLENLKATLTPLGSGRDCGSEPMVQSGFLSLYTSSPGDGPSLRDQVRGAVARILEEYKHEPLSLTITGHSLGAALATLMAHDVKKTFEEGPSLVTVVSFAGPRVGNRSFGAELEGKGGAKVLRIVNSDDVVTKVPGFVRDGYYTAVSELIRRWVYADVGCELRLSSRESPDLSGINVVACHELKTYLHLVNGFVSSNCPIRATARKMMMIN